MVCADILDLKKDLEILNQLKLDYFHLDLADGVFLPRFGLSSHFMKAIRQNTKVPFDFHLKTSEVKGNVEFLDIRHGDMVSFHIEAIEENELKSIVEQIRQKASDVKVGIAVYPKTDLDYVKRCLDKVDFVLLMAKNSDRTAYPGFQDKLKQVIQLAKKQKHNVIVGIDGEVTPITIPIYKALGVGLVVCGTGCLFNKNGLAENMKIIRKLIS